MPKPSRDFLARLLEGAQPTEPELVAVIQQCSEDQWLDYKAGALLAGPKAAAVVREYVSGFANAEGGTLVIGYDETPPGHIDDAEAPGGRTLSGWAADAVASLPMAPPRFTEVATPHGSVLLIATQRSRSLVPCIEDGESVYHYRLGDTTREMPQSLVADLMLGRRSEVRLRATAHRGHWEGVGATVGRNVSVRPLRLELTIETQNLGFADDVRTGLVTWCLLTRDRIDEPATLLRQQLSLERPLFYDFPAIATAAPWGLVHIQSKRFRIRGVGATGMLLGLGPFEQVTGGEELTPWPVPIFLDLSEHVGAPPAGNDQTMMAQWKTRASMLRGRVRLEAGLYVVARGSEPWWHQLTWEYSDAITGVESDLLGKVIRIERLYEGRPRVAFTFLPIE